MCRIFYCCLLGMEVAFFMSLWKWLLLKVASELCAFMSIWQSIIFQARCVENTDTKCVLTYLHLEHSFSYCLCHVHVVFVVT